MSLHEGLNGGGGWARRIDQAVWHCALPNTTDTPRRNVIFGLSGEGSAAQAGGALAAAVEENIAAGFMAPEQRESFGL